MKGEVMTDFWPAVSEERGFLANPDPLAKLPSSSIFNYLDSLAADLPEYVRRGVIRSELRKLPEYGFAYNVLSAYKERNVLNRLRMLYGYFASAFVHGEPDFDGKIPSSIAKPLCALSELVKRPPILSYADYALNNWKRIDITKPIELNNIKLMQYFHGLKDEAWFILIHVDIEAKAGKLLRSLYDLTEFIWSGEKYHDDLFKSNLTIIRDVFKDINSVMARMPEQCSPDVYYKKVRPYIFGFENVIYSGVSKCSFFNQSSGEQTFRGETGAQSSIVPAILSGLGVKHNNSVLTVHLNDMKKYMPSSHRNFLSHLDQSISVKEYLNKEKPGKHIMKLFNQVMDELVKFREIHLKYAVDYIENKCDNPKGTGGTIFIKWLSELVNETKQQYIKE